ncbi:MAG TPA: SDR family NAD(P)-dependent oxidoreductase [Jatrophihabitans sp.]|jgi:NAD(P)-dependent dehydrogenase (short-subunit alcohol dehydrogenase family)
MTEQLKDQVAVVTGSGGTRSIGRATAKLFAENGAKVVLADINADALDITVKELQSDGHDVIGVPVDVSDFDSVTSLADAAWSHYGKVDIAFLNAGVPGGGTLFDDAMDEWRRVFDVNFFGILNGIKNFAPRMMAQGTPGHILGTASGAGTTGTNWQTPVYSTSKQAILTLMECLYGQLSAAGSLVKAHTVFPPLTKSGLAGDPEIMNFVLDSLEKGGVTTVLAEPEEVAQTVLDAIVTDNFWGSRDHDSDQRLSGGRFIPSLDWEAQVVRAKAEAMINRTSPDAYVWGGK